MFAANAGKWGEGSRFVRTTRPDQQGRFRIAGLPPGEYLAVALEYVEQFGEQLDPTGRYGAWDDPEYLESLRPRVPADTLLPLQ